MSTSIQRAAGGAPITGDWVRASDLPSSRGLSRGYDRKAVDALLAHCANGVDRLNGALVSAHHEIERLTEVNSHRRLVGAAGRAPVASHQRKRTPQQKAARARRALRRPAVVPTVA